MNDSQLRYAVAAIVAALMAYIVLRSAFLRRAGVPVNQLGATGNRSQRIFVALAVAFGVYLLARAPFPAVDKWVRGGASPAPEAALGVLVVASLFIAAAQGGMGKSWRVGVPSRKGDVERLVTRGPNRISRNPIYLGIMALLIGVALAAPGPLTIAAIVITFAGLSAIISREEKYLKDRFGDEYENYARRVRRWI